MRTPESEAKASPERRRRFPWRFLALVVVAGILVGIGGRWIGHGRGSPVAGTGPVARVGAGDGIAAKTVLDGAVALPQPPMAATTPLTSPAEAAAAPLAETAPAAGAEQPAGVDARVEATVAPPVSMVQALDHDRFACMVSLLQGRAETRRFTEAFEVLSTLREQALDAAQRAALTEVERELGEATLRAAAAIAELVQSGHVMAAREAFCPSELACRPYAAALASALGAPTADWLAAPAADRSAWPRPAPLARESRVRTVVKACDVIGVVVDGRSDTVTLRVASSRGQTFPTVPVIACEPIDGSAAAAAEMGFAALHAGDPLLARLWLCAARLHGGSTADSRVERLAELLR